LFGNGYSREWRISVPLVVWRTQDDEDENWLIIV